MPTEQTSTPTQSEDAAKTSVFETPLRVSLDFGTLAHWFIPIVGIIYSAGFLIVFTFSKSFGIDGTELFQGKYIHVGSLFAMACVVVTLPVFWGLQVAGSSERTGRYKLATIAGLSIYSLMLFTFYVIVAFTERGFFHRNAGYVLWNFAIPCAYSFFRYCLPNPLPEDGKLRTLDAMLGVLFCLIQTALTIVTLALTMESEGKTESLWYHLGRIFPVLPPAGPSGVYGFILLMVLSVLYAGLAGLRWRQTTETRQRLTLLFSALCVVGMLFYLGVLAYAYAVYSYIPSAKGGGGYIDGIQIKVTFREPAMDSVHRSMGADDSPFLMIYQNSDSVFLASKQELQGPSEWQKPGSSKPKVYELRRETLKDVTYINPIATPNPAATP